MTKTSKPMGFFHLSWVIENENSTQGPQKMEFHARLSGIFVNWMTYISLFLGLQNVYIICIHNLISTIQNDEIYINIDIVLVPMDMSDLFLKKTGLSITSLWQIGFRQPPCAQKTHWKLQFPEFSGWLLPGPKPWMLKYQVSPMSTGRASWGWLGQGESTLAYP